MDNATKKNTTLDYLESAEIGSIVAFNTVIKGVERTLSGKLIDRITEREPNGNRIAVIETKNGSTFEIDHENVIWVKTGDRWPRWVFEQLKKK